MNTTGVVIVVCFFDDGSSWGRILLWSCEIIVRVERDSFLRKDRFQDGDPFFLGITARLFIRSLTDWTRNRVHDVFVFLDRG